MDKIKREGVLGLSLFFLCWLGQHSGLFLFWAFVPFIPDLKLTKIQKQKRWALAHLSQNISVSLCIMFYTTCIWPFFRSKDLYYSIFQPCVSTSNSGLDNEKSEAKKALGLNGPINNARRVQIHVKSSIVITCNKWKRKRCTSIIH